LKLRGNFYPLRCIFANAFRTIMSTAGGFIS
jgi:hypothetical protein